MNNDIIDLILAESKLQYLNEKVHMKPIYQKIEELEYEDNFYKAFLKDINLYDSLIERWHIDINDLNKRINDNKKELNYYNERYSIVLSEFRNNSINI